MGKFTKLPFKENDLNGVLADFFKKLMQKNIVDGLLVPMVQSGLTVMQTLVTDPDYIQDVDPFAPVVPVNSAKLVSNLTASPSGRTLGLVLRPCEVRALVELVKLNQASLDNVLIISFDCLGRYENKDFLHLRTNNQTTENFLNNARKGITQSHGVDICDACKCCEHLETDNVDLRICVLGAEENMAYIEQVSPRGEKALKGISMGTAQVPAKRKSDLKELKSTREENLKLKLEEYNSSINTLEKLKNNLAACINCYNCRVACPVCYCRECVFSTDTFRHKGDQYMDWAQTKGKLKMPTDTVFYHLTRMAHIGLLCVGCGQCTSACPNGIELMPVFRSAAQKTQARFDYQAGRALDEKQPLGVFHSEELVEVTGQVK